MLKRVYNQNRCTGCGICTINCPQKILKISNGHCVITDALGVKFVNRFAHILQLSLKMKKRVLFPCY